MKRILMAVLVLGFAATCVQAAPSGNPAPDLSKTENRLSAGFEGDWVFDRELDDDLTELETSAYAGKIAYTIEDMAQLYVVLGAGDLEMTDDSTTSVLETDFGFLWGVGGTVAVHEWDNGVRFGITGRYRRSKQDIGKLTVGATDFTSIVTDLLYQDWQVAFGVSKDFDWGTPYFGVRYNDVSISDIGIVGGTTIDEDANSDQVVGVVVGIEANVAENINLAVEGRFIDETAVTAHATILF